MNALSPSFPPDLPERRAKAAARFSIVRRAADECVSKEEAARRAGLTAAGLNTLLYDRTGSTVWPPSL